MKGVKMNQVSSTKSDYSEFLQNLQEDELINITRKIKESQPIEVITNKQVLKSSYEECKALGALISEDFGQFTGIDSEVYSVGNFKYEFLFEKGKLFECSVNFIYP